MNILDSYRLFDPSSSQRPSAAQTSRNGQSKAKEVTKENPPEKVTVAKNNEGIKKRQRPSQYTPEEIRARWKQAMENKKGKSPNILSSQSESVASKDGENPSLKLKKAMDEGSVLFSDKEKAVLGEILKKKV